VSTAIDLTRAAAIIDLRATCGPMTGGGGDPTWSIRPDRVARAMHTPDGPASIEVTRRRGRLDSRAFGPGADWILERVPVLLGLDDDPRGFRPDLHPLVADTARRRPGTFFGAGMSVWDVAVPTILGQRVTTGEARRSWWGLVRRFGNPAPGPLELRLAPSPRVIRRLGDADWHVLGVERKRADAIRGLTRVLPAVERSSASSTIELRRVLETIPGIGPWTSTGLAISVLGDPDVVLLGDLHLPHTICHALAGEPRGSDERMLELLAPFVGHRGRVVRLMKWSGNGAPRRGPRYSPIPIARL